MRTLTAKRISARPAFLPATIVDNAIGRLAQIEERPERFKA
jgi:hypothetical protein